MAEQLGRGASASGPQNTGRLVAPDRARRSWVRRHGWLTVGLAVATIGAVLAVAIVVRSAVAEPDAQADGGSAGFGAAVVSPSASPTIQPSRTPSSAAPTPSPARPTSPPSVTGFPGAHNTGVPSGTTLRSYTGPCTIRTAGTVIDSRLVKCTLLIRAKNVTIRRSKIVGTVDSDSTGSLTLVDSEIDAGTAYVAALGERHLTVRRVDIRGGHSSVNCVRQCLIEHSWLHGQYVPPNEDWHLDAFVTSGGENITLRHNTIACDARPTPADGGCSADAAIFGDFAPNRYITFDHNLFVASTGVAYCLYGGSHPDKPYGDEVDHIVVVNNVFQRGTNGKCAAFGAVTEFDVRRPGNRWENNVWDDGTPVAPVR